MRHKRRQVRNNRGQTADCRRLRFKPAWLSHFSPLWKTADGGEIQTADKAIRPLYAKGERKREDSFFYSLYTKNLSPATVITADSNRPRFVPAYSVNPAVRVHELAGSVIGGQS